MLGTRAVVRQIEPGSAVRCASCELEVKFVAKAGSQNRKQVIANVYEGGKWVRVDHFHPECYAEAGDPHGPALDTRAFKPKLPA